MPISLSLFQLILYHPALRRCSHCHPDNNMIIIISKMRSLAPEGAVDQTKFSECPPYSNRKVFGTVFLCAYRIRYIPPSSGRRTSTPRLGKDSTAYHFHRSAAFSDFQRCPAIFLRYSAPSFLEMSELRR